MRLVTSCCLVGAMALLGNSAWAQSVISAHSGLVHYVEGRVLLGDKEIDPKFGEFPDIRNNQILKTEEGRAEVLLSPGVFLRVAENSSIRMLSNKLTDTRLEIVSGKALVECAEVTKEDTLTIQTGGDSVRPVKSGLYEFFANPASVRVYQGEAVVESANGQVTVKKGREAMLAAAVEEHKFDTSQTDDLYNWTSRRSGYLAAANISSAKQMSSGSGYGGFGYGGFGYSGFGYSGFGYNGLGWGYPYGMMGAGMYSGWAWNPLFGMFTYVPYDGIYMNPFGYAFWSPYTVGYVLPAYYTGGAPVVSRGGVPSRPGHGSRITPTSSAPYRTASTAMIARTAARSATTTASASRGGWSGSGGGFSGGGRSSTMSVSSTGSMGAGHVSGGGRR